MKSAQTTGPLSITATLTTTYPSTLKTLSTPSPTPMNSATNFTNTLTSSITPSSFNDSSNPTSFINDPSNPTSRLDHTGPIVGLTLGGIIVLVVTGFLIYNCIMRRRGEGNQDPNGENTGGIDMDTRPILAPGSMRSWASGANIRTQDTSPMPLPAEAPLPVAPPGNLPNIVHSESPSQLFDHGRELDPPWALQAELRSNSCGGQLTMQQENKFGSEFLQAGGKLLYRQHPTFCKRPTNSHCYSRYRR